MKKYKGAIITVVCSSLVILTSCGSVSSIKGSFKESEYILSRNEEVDLLKDFSCKGFSVGDVSISFSQEDMLSFDSASGKFKAGLKSGEVTAFAKVKGQVIASSKIFIKDVFSAVEGISLSSDGVLSWQESYVIYGGQKVEAENYLLKINQQTVTVNSNSYQIEDRGQYTVQIQALGNDRIDSSALSESVTCFYKVMPQISAVTSTNSTAFGSSDFTLTWDYDQSMENAQFKIKANGIVLKESTKEKSITFSTGNFSAGERIELEIEAFDPMGENLSNFSSFQIYVPSTPEPSYSLDEKGGKIVFEPVAGAREYIGRVHQITESGTKETFIGREHFVYNGGQIETYVDGFDYGVYQISIQAIGDSFYSNSKISDDFLYIKLAQPEIEHKVEGENLVLSLASTENLLSENFLVNYGDEEVLWDLSQGELTLDISSFEKGEHLLQVRAIPNLNGQNIEINGVNSRTVISSNPYEGNFYLLDEIGSITHAFANDEKSLSLLTFDQIDFTDEASFQLLLNGEELNLTPLLKEGKVEFQIENLSSFSSKQGQYIFTLKATRADGTSNMVMASKTLKILSSPTKSESQVNGIFSWDEVEGQCQYFYKVYKTQSDYVVEENAKPVLETVTNETQTSLLNEGYYNIKVYTRSTDENNFLSSDFESDNSLNANFYVTKQIEKPQISLREGNENFYLDITHVANATHYDIYIGERKIASMPAVSAQEGEVISHQFAEKFDDDGMKYAVKVIARNNQDDTIYQNSSSAEFEIVRLAAPTFEVDVKFDKKGEKSSEVLSVKTIENSSGINIYDRNGSILSSDGKIDFLSLSDLTLKIKHIAKEKEDGVYYLDSNLKTFSFTRAQNPTNMKYSFGDISFDGLNENDYIAFVTLVNQNPAQNLTVDKKFRGTNFDISSFITQMCKDSDFEYYYGQADKIEVVIYNISISGTTISSTKGTAANGESKLTLEKLEAPKLSFNNSTMLLEWNAVGQGTKYNVYIKGETDQCIGSDLSGQSLNLSTLDIDFTDAKEIFVVAENSSYLTSSSSNILSLRRLASVENIKIIKSADGWVLAFDIVSSDLDKISEVLVDGKNVFTSESAVSVKLSSLTQDVFDIQIKTAEVLSGTEDVYISSIIRSFSLTDISSKTIDVTVENGKLKWQAVASDFVANGENPLGYSISIYNTNPDGSASSLAGKISINDTSISLNELASRAGVSLANGNYAIEVSTQIADYVLSDLSGKGKGYFGQASSEIFALKKLEAVAFTAASLYSNSANIIDQKKSASVKLEWDDKWQSFSEVEFEISIEEVSQTVSLTSVQKDISLALENGKYVLTLANSLFGENDLLKIKVHNSKAISSEEISLEFERLSNPADVKISSEGNLSFTTKQDENYLIKCSIGNSTVELFASEVMQNGVVDLLEIFADGTGSFSVEVLAFAKDFSLNNLCLSPKTSVAKNGTRLAKLEGVEIDELGTLKIKTAANFTQGTFICKADDKTINLPLAGESGNFEITLEGLVEKFEGLSLGKKQIQISLSEFNGGSSSTGTVIPSPFEEVVFNYKNGDGNVEIKRGRNGSESFVVISDPENIETTSFILGVAFNQFAIDENGQKSLEEKFEVLSTLAKEYKGFWIVEKSQTQTIEYFSKTTPSESEGVTITSSSCFGIDLSQLLAMVEYGKVELVISRVAKEIEEGQSIYTLYQKQTLNSNKINMPANVHFVENEKATLVWDWERKPVDDDLTDVNDCPEISGFIVYLTEADGGNQAIFVSGQSLNIFDYLSANIDYEVSVQAISNSSGVIASNRTEPIKIRQYQAPSKVKVNDGKIIFDVDDYSQIDFIKFFEENYSDPTFAQKYVSEKFSSLFSFDIDTFSSQKIRLTFKSVNSQAQYSALVNATSLIPDISEVKLGNGVKFLDALNDRIPSGSTGSYEGRIRSFYNALISLNWGIADNKILFDDFGKDIPAGEYFVTASHFSNAQTGKIESVTSQQTALSVSPPVSYTLAKDDNSDYVARFNLATISPSQGESIVSYSYRMAWRKNGKTVYTFLIEGSEEGSWSIKFEDENRFITSPNPISYDSASKIVTLNLSQMARNSVDIGFKKDAYVVEIYALGNNYAANGKSGKFTAEFLDFADTFNFENGQLSWISQSTANTRLVIQQGNSTFPAIFFPTSANQRTTLQLSNKDISNSSPDISRLTLSLDGRVGNESIVIESDRYVIFDSYKLYKPLLSANDGGFNISQPSGNTEKLNEYQYIISNNISKETEDLNDDYIITNPTKEGILKYNPGSFGTENLYHKTEARANTFFVSALGGSGEVNVSHVKNDDYQHVLTLASGEVFAFSSDESQISGRMLSPVTEGEIKIEEGDIVWSDDESDELEEGFKIFYKVIVSTWGNASTPVNTQEFYTANNKFDTSLIEKTLENDKYDFTIQKVVFKISTQEDYDIEINGVYVKRPSGEDAAKYTDGSFVFSSEYQSRNAKDSRTASVSGLKVEEGKICWQTPATKVDYIIFDATENKRITGQFSTKGNMTIFSPTEGQFDKVGSYSHKILIYTVGAGLLKSQAAQLADVYKLKKLENSELDITFSSQNVYSLSAAKYFENNTIKNSNSVYKIVGQISFSDLNSSRTKSFELTSQKSSQNLVFGDEQEGGQGDVVIPVNATNIEVTFKVVKSDNAEFQVDLIDSDSNSISLSSLDWAENDQLSWNEDSLRFEWTFSGEAAQFLVTLVYREGAKLSVLTNDKFFMPEEIGTIVSASIRVRENANSLFSQAITLEETIEYKPFASGNGSENRPYVIANANQFANISKRNFAGIHFSLSQDLTIENVYIDSFNASLDGNGKILSLAAGQIQEIGQTVSLVNDNQKVDVVFKKSSSLFGTISSEGEVKNCQINFTAARTTEYNQNIMLAPLAYKNYGKISNCTLLSSSVSGVCQVQGIYIAAAGLVSVNLGQIDLCQNVSEGRMIELAGTNHSYNFVYGGIAISNSKEGSLRGTISNSFNSGNKNVKVNKGNTSQYLAGIAVASSGKIEGCGNDGEFTSTQVSGISGVKTYMAGIVLRSENGQLYNCYNNAYFTNPTNGKSAGVAFQIAAGSAKGLVDTSEQKIAFYTSQNPVIDLESCFHIAGISGDINCQTIKGGESILTESGKNLTIEKVDERFVAAITN